jgi:hypothetical protein
MDSLEQLEQDFDYQALTKDQMIISHDGNKTRVTDLVRGKDFLAGLGSQGAIAIPLHAISFGLGAGLPEQIATNLNQFLSMQRTPVRLEYLSGDALSRCWLLNVVEDWLRVATGQGVGWIPIQSLRLVWIDPVDN